MNHEKLTNQNAHELISAGIMQKQKHHCVKLFDTRTAEDRAETLAKEEEIRTIHRKQERRIAREFREKDKKRLALKDEIIKKTVKKGELRKPSENFELLDIHQNYDNSKPAQTTLGGFLQQFYFVCCAVLEDQGASVGAYHNRCQ